VAPGMECCTSKTAFDRAKGALPFGQYADNDMPPTKREPEAAPKDCPSSSGVR